LVALAEIPHVGEQGLPDPVESVRPGPSHRELGNLRSENAVLRRRLEAVEALASEREARIDDLLAALRMLPAAWTERLRRAARQPPETDPEYDAEVVEAEWEESEAPANDGKVTTEDLLDPVEMARAMEAWERVRLLRDRLERDHLERERQRLDAGGGRRRQVPLAIHP
jgi:hypothetical protein